MNTFWKFEEEKEKEEDVTYIDVTTKVRFIHEKVLKKWKPVVDNLRGDEDVMKNSQRKEKLDFVLGEGDYIGDIDEEEKRFRLFLSIYLEYFQRNVDNTVYHCSNTNGMGNVLIPGPPPPPYKIGDIIDSNLSPVNVRILNSLNLRFKHYEIKNGLPDTEVRIPLTNEEFEDIKSACNSDVVWKLEKKIMTHLINKINSELEGKHNFLLDALLRSITVVNTYTKINSNSISIKPELILITSYEIY